MTEQTNLTDSDIANEISIIDVCVRRGSFEGKEVSFVGSVRDRLEGFLAAVTAQKEAEAAAAEGTAHELLTEENPEFPEAR